MDSDTIIVVKGLFLELNKYFYLQIFGIQNQYFNYLPIADHCNDYR
jgi:hypothetical protein